MKRLIMALCLLVVCAPGWGQTDFIGSYTSKSILASSFSMSLVIDASSGWLVIAASSLNSIPVSASDSKGNIYSLNTSVSFGRGYASTIVCQIINALRAGDSITVEFYTPTNAVAIVVGRYDGTIQTLTTLTSAFGHSKFPQTVSAPSLGLLTAGVIGVNGPISDGFMPFSVFPSVLRVGTIGGPPTSNVSVCLELLANPNSLLQAGGILSIPRDWGVIFTAYN